MAVIENAGDTRHGGSRVAHKGEPGVLGSVLRVEYGGGGKSESRVPGGKRIGGGAVRPHTRSQFFAPEDQPRLQSNGDALGSDGFEESVAPPFDAAEVHPPRRGYGRKYQDIVIPVLVTRGVVVAHTPHVRILLEVKEVKKGYRRADADQRRHRCEVGERRAEVGALEKRRVGKCFSDRLKRDEIFGTGENIFLVRSFSLAGLYERKLSACISFCGLWQLRFRLTIERGYGC